MKDLIILYNITPSEQRKLNEYLLFLRWVDFMKLNSLLP